MKVKYPFQRFQLEVEFFDISDFIHKEAGIVQLFSLPPPPGPRNCAQSSASWLNPSPHDNSVDNSNCVMSFTMLLV